MKRMWGIILGAIVLAGCSRGSGTPAATSAAHIEAASLRALPLPEALGEASRTLRSRVDAGTLDALAVEATRAKDTALRIADDIEGLVASDQRELRAATAALATAADALVGSGDRGDVAAARGAVAELEAAAARIAPIAARGRLPEPTGAAAGLPASTADGSREVRLEGEVIDPQCYFTHDGRGVDHAACAKMCARGGQDLAFLPDGGETILPLIAGAHGQDPNAAVIEYAGLPVAVEGVLFTRHGNDVLFVRKIAKR